MATTTITTISNNPSTLTIKNRNIVSNSNTLIISSDKLCLRSSNPTILPILTIKYGIIKPQPSPTNNADHKPLQQQYCLQFQAVYGIVKLNIYNFLILVTKSHQVANINGSRVQVADGVQFVCVDRLLREGDLEWKQQQQYMKIFQQFIVGTRSVYFVSNTNNTRANTNADESSQGKQERQSNVFNLVNSLQEAYMQTQNLTPTMTTTTSATTSATKSIKNNQQFMVNYPHTHQLKQLQGGAAWITSFISGYVAQASLHPQNNNTSLTMWIISRRQMSRQGMRWWSRGVDAQGNAANTVETQTILQAQTQAKIGGNTKSNIYSYVQSRGSIPVQWTQVPNLAWNPTVAVQPDNSSRAIAKLINNCVSKYSAMVFINLVDQKGSQKLLSNQFTRSLQQQQQQLQQNYENKRIQKLDFDFHHQCRNMKYKNLSKLYQQSQQYFTSYGYFCFNQTEQKVVSTQKGVMKVNCMDCLDRTNVAQSMYAKQMLRNWLIEQQILNCQEEKRISDDPFRILPGVDLQRAFRVQWTANADILSTLYSGTPAMKTDFTLANKRTVLGAIKDGITAVRRFIMGNFYDSYKQDELDYVLGKFDQHQHKNKQQTAQNLKNKLKLVRPSLNIIYPIALVYLGIPVISHQTIQKYCQPQQQQTTNADNHDEGSWKKVVFKFGLGLFLTILVSKLLQMNADTVIRKPLLFEEETLRKYRKLK